MNARIFAAMVAVGLTSSAVAQVKINEVRALGVGTDSKEFVELYGPGNTDLSAYELLLVNGSNGLAYQTHDLAGKTIPADGYFVVAGGTLVPNTDFTTGTATNWIQNGDPDSVVLRRKSDQVVIDAVGYFTQYDTTPGTAENATLPAWAYEGAGGSGAGGDDSYNQQTGTGASAAMDENSFGRYPDGQDTNNNQVDIIDLYQGGTPGLPNGSLLNNTLPIVESFTAATGLLRKWQRYYTDIELETAANAVPASIPNSPDTVSPSNWASVKDESGGGDAALVTDFLAKNYYVEGQFYGGSISTVSDGAEKGGFMARMNMLHNQVANNVFLITSPVGVYGDSYYGFHIDYVAGNVEAVKVDKTVLTTLATTPVTVGWHKLAMDLNEGTVKFMVNGATVHTLSGETPRYGYVGVGYRETSAGGTGQVQNNFDALKIDNVGSGVNEWSLF